MPRPDRSLLLRVGLLGLGHLAVFAAAYWAAFCLRFDFSVPDRETDMFCQSLPWILSLKLAVFYFSGHYHGWWRYVTFADLRALLRASALSLLLIVTIAHFIWPFHVPRSVLILDFAVTILLLGTLRSTWRLVREQFWPMFKHGANRAALLIGADHSAALLAYQIQSHPQSGYRIRGFLDTNGAHAGTRLGGIPILGNAEQLRTIAERQRVTDILVIAGSLPGKRLRGLMDACQEADLTLKIIPPAEALFNGHRHIPIRDLEINDLLQRDPVQLDSQAIATLLKNRTVLVTGAGGSIGSEICRQVLKFRPRTLILVGKGENRIFFIDRELRSFPLAHSGRGVGSEAPTEICARIGDITDARRMRCLFDEFRPEVIFHAAAHKHVPLMETNAGEAVKNNIGGTKCLADLAAEFGVQAFVLISSDKAVHPANVMGATKHVAERYVLALADESSTRFMVTRFGNVLGSAGSVVPIFQDQIRRGGPITITDQRMTRFFMTIPEASQLVLQAAAMGKGGEIFVLDMGEPVKIIDLARDLIRLSGLPEGAIEIVSTGIRPGEKLYEELYFEDEETLPTKHPKLRAAYHRFHSLPDVLAEITRLTALADGPAAPLRRALGEVVPEFQQPADAPQPVSEPTSVPMKPLPR
jgi:FlaA1/EpsC-like NDP-sugar epimerase